MATIQFIEEFNKISNGVDNNNLRNYQTPSGGLAEVSLRQTLNPNVVSLEHLANKGNVVGAGSEALQKLTKLANLTETIIVAFVSSSHPLYNDTATIEWYKRHGFRHNGGNTVQYTPKSQ